MDITAPVAGGLPVQIATLAADFSVTNNAVLANVPGMALNVAPGNYRFELGLNFNTNAAAIGYRWGWTTTATFGGTTSAMGGIATVAGTPALFLTNIATGQGNTQAAVTSNGDSAVVTGMLRVTAAGQIQLQFAQGTSSATASALTAGSSIVLTRVG